MNSKKYGPCGQTHVQDLGPNKLSNNSVLLYTVEDLKDIIVTHSMKQLHLYEVSMYCTL